MAKIPAKALRSPINPSASSLSQSANDKSVPSALSSSILAPASLQERLPAGYTQEGRLLVPVENRPVPAGKLFEGLEAAKPQIRRMVEEMASMFDASYSVKEIELVASFSAEGKFLGFGVGGEASVKITIAPTAFLQGS